MLPVINSGTVTAVIDQWNCFVLTVFSAGDKKCGLFKFLGYMF